MDDMIISTGIIRVGSEGNLTALKNVTEKEKREMNEEKA